MKDISKIIARQLLKTTGKEEYEAFLKWKNASEKSFSFADHLEAFWNHPENSKTDDRIDLARKRLLTRINAIETSNKPHSTIYYLTRIAAIIILIVSVAGLSVYFTNQSRVFDSNGWVQVSTELGQRSQLTLPDGSVVWLNADTEIKYLADKNSRKVTLDGEAYFEVEHADDYPFVVETGNGMIEVLGTKFNVSNYNDSEVTEASLLSGKISMTLPNHGDVIEIVPGERLTYDSKVNSYSKEIVEVQKDIMWRDGILVFENEYFESLIQKLERFYAVDINYPKEKFKNIHYTGTIDNLRIDRVLEFVSLTLPVTYEINDQQITLNYEIK